MTEQQLWLFLREVLSRGMQIQHDIDKQRFASFAAVSAHQDGAARECVKQFQERFGLPPNGEGSR